MTNTFISDLQVGHEDCNSNVKVTIIGSSEGQKRCKELIKELTDDPPEQNIFDYSCLRSILLGKDKKEQEEEEEPKKKPFTFIDWDLLNKQAVCISL